MQKTDGKKMKKRLLSIILAIILTTLCVTPAFATAPLPPHLLSFYTDNMLFKQKEKAIIVGECTANKKITLELINSKNEVVAKASGKSDKTGNFEVSFTAPEGSYEEYTIIVKKDGKEFAKLKNVVFGELWLASGQSNMQYPLGQAKIARKWMEEKKPLSKNLRVLITPFYQELDGTKDIPSSPLKDIPDSKWITGESEEIYGMSAVAYFFADKLQKEIDMPVGVLNISLGGTSIASWLSREAIDSDKRVKDDLIARERYIEKDKWLDDNRSLYHDMTVNYNLRIEALKHFRLSGMVWYQGETDLMFGLTDENYADSFSLLQKSYTELFSYKNGLLPIVYTQLVSYNYGDNNYFLNRNIAFTEMQKQEKNSRAVVSVYDIPITYLKEVGYIHPESKLEVGERMASAALGLVYGKSDTYTIATPKKTEIKDSSIYVTFENIGDNLISDDEVLEGFAICGADGIYVKANAEIIDKDTVRVWCDSVKEPKSATYAYYLTNGNANLYSSLNGKVLFPVCPFVTDKAIGTHFWVEKPWAECESETVWHNEDDTYTDYYPTWDAEEAGIEFNKEGFIDIKGSASEFCVKPVLTFENANEKNKVFSFKDVDTDYSTYGTITFSVRNNGAEDITFDSLKLYKNSFIWYSAAVAETKGNFAVIPADNQWHTVTLDLNRLYFRGNDCGIGYGNEKLKEIKEIKFCFTSPEGTDGNISLDSIEFTASPASSEKHFDPEKENANNIFEKISCFFIRGLGKFFN